MVNRHWLLTNTTYGTWLPGDDRGFVSNVRDYREGEAHQNVRILHHQFDEVPDVKIRGLELSARKLMSGPPILLSLTKADAAMQQFLETARLRKWRILAAAIMNNHFHIVVEVLGDPKPSKILGDFKSWGTRKLSATFGEPASKTWWTERGSKRILKGEEAIQRAIEYVLNQLNPLVIYRAPDL